MTSTHPLKGVAFCHGHAYNIPVPAYFPDGITWTLIDNNPEVRPDYVLDIWEPNVIIDTLGVGQYDYLLIYNCSFTTYQQFDYLLQLGKILLAPGGMLVLPRGIVFLSLADRMSYRSPEDPFILLNGYRTSDPMILDEVDRRVNEIVQRNGYHSFTFVENNPLEREGNMAFLL